MKPAFFTRGSNSTRIEQRASHRELLRDVTREVLPRRSSGRAQFDAVIVPSGRPASALQHLLGLSASLETPLVVLSSRGSHADEVADRVADTPGARALIVEIPDLYQHEWLQTGTSAVLRNQDSSGGRDSDLSLKRNIGLLLARMLGLQKVVFVDDDINRLGAASIKRMAAQISRNPVAGMIVEAYPDNSVVCHARRLAGLKQDNFVSGAVLGVNCSDLPMSFFPDIYNEDWFFFAHAAARRSLSHAGFAGQAEYSPFETPERARSEEFGDLLAEGLYARFDSGGPDTSLRDHLRETGEAYWSRFQEARLFNLDETAHVLGQRIDGSSWHDWTMHSALRSLDAARGQLAKISPSLCAEFIEAWQDDCVTWARVYSAVGDVGGLTHAMDLLELTNWRISEFGNDDARHTSVFGGLRW